MATSVIGQFQGLTWAMDDEAALGNINADIDSGIVLTHTCLVRARGAKARLFQRFEFGTKEPGAGTLQNAARRTGCPAPAEGGRGHRSHRARVSIKVPGGGLGPCA